MLTLFTVRRRGPIVFSAIFLSMAGWCFQLETVVCTGSDVRLRSGPSIEDEVLGLLDRGQSLYVVKKSSFSLTLDNRDSPWFLVTTPKGKEGWVFGGYLTSTSRKDFLTLTESEKNIWLRTLACDILTSPAPSSEWANLIRKELNNSFSFSYITPADVGYGPPPKDIDGDGIDDLIFKLGPSPFTMVLLLRENQSLPLLAGHDTDGMGIYEFVSIEQIDFNGDKKYELLLEKSFIDGNVTEDCKTDIYRSTFTGGPYTQVGEITLGFYTVDAYAGKIMESSLLGRQIVNVDEDPDLEMVYKTELLHKRSQHGHFESKISIERIIDFSNNAFNITEKTLDISAKQ